MTSTELYEQLRKEICDGHMRSKLPTISELTDRFKVSHCTVKKSLDLLKQQSFIYGHKGKGVFVNEALEKPSQYTVLLYARSFTLSNSFYLKLIRLLRGQLSLQDIKLDISCDVERTASQSADAVIILENVLSDSWLKQFKRRFTAGRLIGVNMQSSDFYTVGSDHFTGGWMGVSYLYEHGHRCLGVVSKDLSSEVRHIFHMRWEGVQAFSSEYPDLIIHKLNIDSDRQLQQSPLLANALPDFMLEHPGITGIFAFTDVLALETLTILQKMKRSVPGDISLIGYDNSEFSALLHPAMTTIEEQAEEVAGLLVEHIQELVKHGKRKRSASLARPVYIERETVRSNAKND